MIATTEQSQASEHTASEKVGWVIASDPLIGEQLQAGLAHEGFKTRIFVPDQQTPDGNSALLSSVAQAIDEATSPNIVLLSLLPEKLCHPQSIEELGPDQWRAMVHAPVMLTFQVMAKLGKALSGKQATVVVIGPTLGHIGGAGITPLCTVLEAQRGMVKSAARQWGERGLTVSWVGVAPEAYNVALGDLDRTTGPEFGPAHRAIGRVPALSDAAQAATLLATPAGRMITGHTINVDGGEWMLP